MEDSGTMPDQAYLDENFGRLWDRCMGAGSSALPASTAQQLREACFRRFSDAARASVERQNNAEQRSRSQGGLLPKRGPRSLFANIGDVLATSSTRLHSGQACIVRYRLIGVSNFWHPSHQVLKNEREAVKWPISKKNLGCTPFIGLVPRGLQWTSAGGGGFYLNNQAFAGVDANLRADLPRDPPSGLPLLFGHVLLHAPSLDRLGRGRSETGLVEEFELRLFCSSKNKIVGCIGEPLPVTIMHKVPPPPLEAIQVRIDGRVATVRWGIMDLGLCARQTSAECVRVNMKSDKMERTFTLEPQVTELEVPDLLADMEYEFRARMENRTGAGREVSVMCRTNACCSPPGQIVPHVVGTTLVELRWSSPKVIGNETTKDRFQQSRDSILFYQATLKVDEENDKSDDVSLDDALTLGVVGNASSNSRKCQWKPGQWKEDKDGVTSCKLGSLRPDTKYSLEGLCAVNSMGAGMVTKTLVFWTSPLQPQIAGARVRHGLVFLALAHTGGICIKEFNVSAQRTNDNANKSSFTLPIANLSDKHEGRGVYPELSMPFEQFSVSEKMTETHTFKVRSANPGGWSEWCQPFETCAVARQQGAQRVQVQLIKAIETHKLEELAQVLELARDIELPDPHYFEEASAQLNILQSAHNELARSVQVRDPEPLRQALERAREVGLPDLDKPVELLALLEAVAEHLETAKGIDELKQALKDANDAGLLPELLQPAIRRLSTRETAQQSLEQAMVAARVPVLEAALASSVDMHLPSEEAARVLLAELHRSELLLSAALTSELIVDFDRAMKSVEESGLREFGLIDRAVEVLDRLQAKREAARTLLMERLEMRNPMLLREAYTGAIQAQVPQSTLEDVEKTLLHLEYVMRRNEEAVGLEARQEALVLSQDAQLPTDLHDRFALQHRRLGELFDAAQRGCVEVLRVAVKRSEQAGVKTTELADFKALYVKWKAADSELEISQALGATDRLRSAIDAALKVGIAEDQLNQAKEACVTLEARGAAEQALREQVVARQLEGLHSTLIAACDAEVSDIDLIESAKVLLGRLFVLRAEVAVAMEHGTLMWLFDTLNRASTPPALPDEELLLLKKRLQEEEATESEYLTKHLTEVVRGDDYRGALSLMARRERARRTAVKVAEELVEQAQIFAEEKQQDCMHQREHDLLKERTVRDYQTWNEDTPKQRERHSLPKRVVTGQLELAYEPAGCNIFVLPREIVQAVISVLIEDEKDAECHVADGEIALYAADRIRQGIKRLLDPKDDVIPLTEHGAITDDDGHRRRQESALEIREGRLDTKVAVFVRATHCGTSVARVLLGSSIVRENGSAEDGTAASRVEAEDAELDEQGVEALSQRLSVSLGLDAVSTVHKAVMTPTGSASTRRLPADRSWCLADHVREVRPRVLGCITVELSWNYPRGLLDSLDPTCVAYDAEEIVDIVDHRGSHGFKYAPALSPVLPPVPRHLPSVASTQRSASKQRKPTRSVKTPADYSCKSAEDVRSQGSNATISNGISPRLEPSNKTVNVFSPNPRRGGGGILGDSTWNSVRHVGDVMDTARRQGKQALQIRLDLLPPRITDLVIVLSAYNSRDLTKFHDLTASIIDTKESRLLTKFHAKTPPEQTQAVIMLSISRGHDGLWRVLSFGAGCRGTSRDYRPILSKLGDLGFPRNVGMRRQVTPLLETIQTLMRVETAAVKATEVVLSSAHSMTLRYAVELFGSNVERGSNLVKYIDTPKFHSDLATALRTSNDFSVDCDGTSAGNRFLDSHLSLQAASWHGLEQVVLQLNYGFPASSEFQNTLHLDGTIVSYEQQGLRELVDYQGPHGVRIVHNGVVDYAGIWVGHTGIGDAMGGAASHAGSTIDDSRKCGCENLRLRLDIVPRSVSDVFVVLSSPAGHDLATYRWLQMRLLDADNLGHELARSNVVPPPESTSCLVCCLSRVGNGWRLDSFGSRIRGSASDYRPMLLCLASVQEARQTNLPQWPHKSIDQRGKHFGSRPTLQGCRLPKLYDTAKSEEDDGASSLRSSSKPSTKSSGSSSNSHGTADATQRTPRVPLLKPIVDQNARRVRQ
eukprot:TRINITY_DN25845_c0_g1_i1.p1 TRINITY_DN25845_c0_g1~~TRINITY_DN25845_c0_g1_i1.p1  ORF type:complete len:2159 (-),score=377.22 TRINITY_DN25845_c0_g1_i1:70-6249(-)